MAPHEDPIDPFDIDAIFPDSDPGSERHSPLRLPRRQDGSPQELAITLVADYTLVGRGWLPSAALVSLLNAEGITEAAARTVISRLSRRGLLEGLRDGRRTHYRLRPDVATRLAEAGRWIGSFAAGLEPWDGFWTLVAYSMPKDESLQRRKLRGQLRWHGFAPLYDGLWVAARPPHPSTERQLRASAGGAMTVFRARRLDIHSSMERDPLDAWDLDAIAERYARFLEAWAPVAGKVAGGEIRGADAVRTRTEVMDAYRRFPILDPRLPLELLPPSWPRLDARRAFVAVYDGLAEPAQEHVRETSTASGVDLDRIRAHTSDQLSAGLGYPSPDS